MGSQMPLDDVCPRWHFRERHEIPVDAPEAAVMAAVEAMTWRDVPVASLLIRVRGLGRLRVAPDRTVVGDMTARGFTVLSRDETELVIGVLSGVVGGRGAVPLGDPPARQFRTFGEPGHVKIATNFRTGGDLLTTETRVWCTDAAARRRFRAYWTLIRPFSGLIRREWLRAIRRRAGGGV